MKKNIIQGQFTAKDAVELITQMIHVKIKFHEDKINQTQNEEDVKMREKRIKELQKDLFEIRENMAKQEGLIDLKMELEM
jgi:hypothetical protein